MGAKKTDNAKKDISSCEAKPRLVDIDALFGKKTIPDIKKGLEKGGIQSMGAGACAKFLCAADVPDLTLVQEGEGIAQLLDVRE